MGRELAGTCDRGSKEVTKGGSDTAELTGDLFSLADMPPFPQDTPGASDLLERLVPPLTPYMDLMSLHAHPTPPPPAAPPPPASDIPLETSDAAQPAAAGASEDYSTTRRTGGDGHQQVQSNQARWFVVGQLLAMAPHLEYADEAGRRRCIADTRLPAFPPPSSSLSVCPFASEGKASTRGQSC